MERIFLSVLTINSNNARKYKTKLSSNNSMNFKANNTMPKFDYAKDDGRISPANALKHFAKGIISPITALLSSPKAMLTGALAIGASACLTALFPPLLPVFIASGIVIGAYNIAKGALKAATATTDKKTEEGWENIGAGTFSLGTSVLGSKKALKASGVENAEKMSYLKASYECIKGTKTNIIHSYKMLKNGTALTSIKNSFKKIECCEADDIVRLEKAGYPKEKLDEIRRYADQLHQEGLDAVESPNGAIDEIRRLLPEQYQKNLEFRVKSAASIKDKIIRKLTDPNEKYELENIEQARGMIRDLVGTKITVDRLSQSQIDEIIASLNKGFREGGIRPIEIDNYSGKNITPYLTEANIDSIKEAAISAKSQTETSYIGAKNKGSGYTSAQINVTHSNGVSGELQIRSTQIDSVANIEHIPYDIRQGKDISSNNPLVKRVYSQIEKSAQNLSKSGEKSYGNYLNKIYEYNKAVEQGLTGMQEPQIGDFFTGTRQGCKSQGRTLQQIKDLRNLILQDLDVKNLGRLHEEASWLKYIPRVCIGKHLVYNVRNVLELITIKQKNKET